MAKSQQNWIIKLHLQKTRPKVMLSHQLAELVHLLWKLRKIASVKAEPSEVGHLRYFLRQVCILSVCVHMCACVWGGRD